MAKLPPPSAWARLDQMLLIVKQKNPRLKHKNKEKLCQYIIFIFILFRFAAKNCTQKAETIPFSRRHFGQAASWGWFYFYFFKMKGWGHPWGEKKCTLKHAKNMNSLIFYGQTSAKLLLSFNYGILKATIISIFLRIWGNIISTTRNQQSLSTYICMFCQCWNSGK